MPFRRRIALVPAAFLAAVGSLAAQPSGALTAVERVLLVEHLRGTGTALEQAASGLTDAQWRYRPRAGMWSIAECVEHLILSEDHFFSSATAALGDDTAVRHGGLTFPHDGHLIRAIEDRRQRMATPAHLEPAGRWAAQKAALGEYRWRRGRSIRYATSTQAFLRSLFVPVAMIGTMDAYQTLLMMSAHTARHLAQIEEIKASPGFPRLQAADTSAASECRKKLN